MTHCRLASEMPRSCWACGSAMFTIVESSTTINWAREMNHSAFQRRGSGCGILWISAVSDMEVSTYEDVTNEACGPARKKRARSGRHERGGRTERNSGYVKGSGAEGPRSG